MANLDATIAAIPTRYAGCHFRSRLEARWAVFFDHLGIRWEYEPQGFECGWRLTWDTTHEPFRYLPDFWLPDHKMWIEVKGSLTDDECARLLNAAAWLSTNGGGAGCGSGANVAFLGPVPRPDTDWLPISVHMHKGDLLALPWGGEESHCYGYGRSDWVLATDSGARDEVADGLTIEYVKALIIGGTDQVTPAPWRRALVAARSARFEHGQSGAT